MGAESWASGNCRVVVEPTTIAGLIGGKKIMMGIAAMATVPITSFDTLKGWHIIIAIAAAIFIPTVTVSKFIGTHEEKMRNLEYLVKEQDEGMREYVESRVSGIDFMATTAFNRSELGGRFTSGDGKDMRNEILENSKEDNIRHDSLDGRIGRCESKLNESNR